MRSHRFYTPISLAENALIELPSDAAHHCAQVLRYKVADELTVFNGDGFDYLATVDQIEKKRCLIKTSQKIDPKNESPLKVHLFQGIARGDKMDLIIQKAIELGVAEITPLFTERCNVKLDGKRLDKKLLHWNKTAISACEQSGRAIIPKINQPMSIVEIQKENTTTLYLEPTSKTNFRDITFNQSVRLIIGPEGGFSEKDLSQLDLIECKNVKVGPRILRTETAGLSAISILQSLYGDI